MDSQTLELRNLHCPDCAATIQKAVRALPGVLRAEVNFASVELHVEFERAVVSLDQICRLVAKYDVEARAAEVSSSPEGVSSSISGARMWASAHRRKLVTLIGGMLTLLGMACRAIPLHLTADWLYAAAILIGGCGIASTALQAARTRVVDMNLLVVLAVSGAMGIGDWAEGASVIALYNIGNLLQISALERTRSSLRSLMQLNPRAVRVRRDGRETEIPVEQVEIGDVVAIRPGERIPTDGLLIEGHSAVNESAITGESLPVEKEPGTTVYAGTLNGAGALSLRVTHAYRDSTLARIISHVDMARSQRAPTQEFIDRFARVYTPLVVLLAAVVALLPPLVLMLRHTLYAVPLETNIWQTWFVRALSLLLISCPCALVISTPVALVTAIGRAARNGILVKGGRYLEAIGSIRALLYDKTGTLTRAECHVEAISPLAEMGETELIRLAAALEARSDHPLASAFAEAARKQGDDLLPFVRNLEAVPGGGVRGKVGGQTYLLGNCRLMGTANLAVQSALPLLERAESRGHTAVLLADAGRVLGVIEIGNAPRPQAAEVIQSLHKLGIHHQAMLTGDSARTARVIGSRVGLEDIHAALLPEQKLEQVRAYRARYGAVAMVGDGVNDAPALAAADVGIAFGARGSDTALETADIAIMGDDLASLPYLIDLSRRLRAIIRQNVAFSLLTKGLLLLIAVTVGIPLWLAVVGDVGVSLAVTLNALRLHDRQKG